MIELNPGWKALPIGSANSLDNSGSFVALEEGLPEGSLLLAEIDFSEYPSQQSIAELEQKLADANIDHWPGMSNYVIVDTRYPAVYIAWQKAPTFWAVIGGILAVMILPAILSIGLWYILPAEVKSMIEMMISMIMMIGMMAVMMLVMKQLNPPEKAQIEGQK